MAAQTKSAKISVKVINQAGKTSDLDVTDFFNADELSGAKLNFIHQVLHSYLNNQRQATAKVKTRCEVRGGGRKPWRQKGTGRARQGSTRSPLWRKGGVVFGPTGQQNYKQALPQKMKQKALRVALLDAMQNNSLIVLENYDQTLDSTKKMRQFLGGLPIKSNALVVFAPESLSLARFTDNLEFVQTKADSQVNALDVFQAQTIVMTQESLQNILRRINSPVKAVEEKPTSLKTKKTASPRRKTAKTV